MLLPVLPGLSHSCSRYVTSRRPCPTVTSRRRVCECECWSVAPRLGPTYSHTGSSASLTQFLGLALGNRFRSSHGGPWHDGTMVRWYLAGKVSLPPHKEQMCQLEGHEWEAQAVGGTGGRTHNDTQHFRMGSSGGAAWLQWLVVVELGLGRPAADPSSPLLREISRNCTADVVGQAREDREDLKSWCLVQ